jgi:hypothetical protein
MSDFIPGLFQCKTCGFVLQQFTMSAVDGSVGERDAPGEKCPNDGSPLWRMTDADMTDYNDACRLSHGAA